MRIVSLNFFFFFKQGLKEKAEMNLDKVRKKVCNLEGWMIISYPFQ